MEQRVITPSEQLDDVRTQLAEAYDREDTARLFELSRQIDDLQLFHWGVTASVAS